MKKYVLFVFFMFYFGQFAYSADMNGYVGGNVGQADYDTKITLGTATLDEDDLGWKIYGGVNINEYFALEVQYADFGAASLNGVNGSTFTVDGVALQFITTAALDGDADSIGFSAVAGWFPLRGIPGSRKHAPTGPSTGPRYTRPPAGPRPPPAGS